MTKLNTIATCSFYLILLLSIFFGCSKTKEIEPFDSKIINSIIFDVIDKTIDDFRIKILPSPKDFLTKADSDSLYRERDSLQKLEILPLKVVVEDTVSYFEVTDVILNKLNLNDSNKNFNFLKKTKKSKKQKIDIDYENFNKLNSKYKIISFEDFDEKKAVIYKNEPRVIVGKYAFSKVILNKNKDFGVLVVRLSYNSKFGSSYILQVKKINKIWIIEKIIPYGIS